MPPEPYPQEKWTPEQEAAYAEGRKSAKRASRQTPAGASPSGSRRKRVVRTEAGARRYHVPIGAEIGTARNSSAKQAQRDVEATDKYNDLVGQDASKQAAAMKGLDDGQLQRLSMVAYSWKTSDPAVVRLRIGVANELKRRGFNVNDFGGLGPKSKPAAAAPAAKPAAAPAVTAKKRPTAIPVRKSGMQARAKDRRLTQLSVPQLRQALSAVGKMPPDKRGPVAKYLVRQAVELGVPHFLGQTVLELSGVPHGEAIELAGRWKHGYIPLDAIAMREKMKGGNGKPWWSGGKQTSVGSKTYSRSVEAGRKARAAKAARKKPSTNKEVTKVTGGKPKPFVAVPKRGGERRVVTTEVIKHKGGPVVPGTRRIGPAAGFKGDTLPKPRKDFVNNKDTKNRYKAKTASDKMHAARMKAAPEFEAPEFHENVVKGLHESGNNRLTVAIDKMDAGELRTMRGRLVSGKKKLMEPSKSGEAPAHKDATLATYDRLIAKIDAKSGKSPASRHAGASMSDRDFAKLQMDRDAAPKGRQRADLTKRVNNELARRQTGPNRTNVVKSSPKPERGSKMNRTRSVLTLKDGSKREGTVVSETDTHVRVRHDDGSVRRYPKENLKSVSPKYSDRSAENERMMADARLRRDARMLARGNSGKA